MVDGPTGECICMSGLGGAHLRLLGNLGLGKSASEGDGVFLSKSGHAFSEPERLKQKLTRASIPHPPALHVEPDEPETTEPDRRGSHANSGRGLAVPSGGKELGGPGSSRNRVGARSGFTDWRNVPTSRFVGRTRSIGTPAIGTDLGSTRIKGHLPRGPPSQAEDRFQEPADRFR